MSIFPESEHKLLPEQKQQLQLMVDLREAQQALQEMQHKLLFLVERNPLAIIQWNTAFEVEDWNPAAVNIFGYTKKEALNRHAVELIAPGSSSEHFNQVMATLLMQKEGVRSSNENITKDGKIITCEWYNTMLTDFQGNVIGVLSIVEDITFRRNMEAALTHREARFKKLAANVPGMIYQFRLAPDGTASFPYVSEGSREIYCLEPQEVQKNAALLTEAVYSEDKSNFLESVAVSAQTLKNWDWQGRIFSRTGELKWVRGISRPELQSDGSILWNGLLIDISDRQQALLELEQLNLELEDRVEERTAQLQHSQQLLKLVFDTLPQRVFWKDKNSIYLGCNQKFALDVGISSPDEISGKDDFDLFDNTLANLHRTDDIFVIENNCPKINYEEAQQKGDGTCVWLRKNKIPLCNLQKEVIGVFGSYEDITQEKQAIEALRQSEAKFRSFVENSSYLIYSHSIEGILSYLSPNVTDILGYESFELIGKSFVPLVHLDDLPNFQKFLNEIIKTGNKQTGIELRVKRKNSTWRWIRISTSPIKNAKGDVIGFQGMISDITERKQAEAELSKQAKELEQALKELQRTQSQLIQSEKMSSLGQLVAGVAHEINNPVNFIFGNLQYAYQYTQNLFNIINLYQTHYPEPVSEIQEEAKNIDLEFLLEDLPKLYSSMTVGATRIREIVTSLRTFARLDEADLKVANIHEGIDSTLMILEHRLKSKADRPGIIVVKEYGNLPLIECYAGQLNQVFMNILVNAIDSLEENYRQNNQQVTPTIHIYTEMPTPKQVIIRIIDNGVGMSNEVRQKLFDPFYTTKPVGKGTGMGLSICYQIITDRHGGSLKCISSLGKGAEFIIEIPIKQKFDIKNNLL